VLVLQSIIDTILQFGLFYGFIFIGYLVAKLSGKGKDVNHYLNLVLINILIPLLFIYTLLMASPDTMTELPLIITLAITVH